MRLVFVLFQIFINYIQIAKANSFLSFSPIENSIYFLPFVNGNFVFIRIYIFMKEKIELYYLTIGYIHT